MTKGSFPKWGDPNVDPQTGGLYISPVNPLRYSNFWNSPKQGFVVIAWVALAVRNLQPQTPKVPPEHVRLHSYKRLRI